MDRGDYFRPGHFCPVPNDVAKPYLPKDADRFFRGSRLEQILGELVSIERDFPESERPPEIQRRYQWLLSALSESEAADSEETIIRNIINEDLSGDSRSRSRSKSRSPGHQRASHTADWQLKENSRCSSDVPKPYIPNDAERFAEGNSDDKLLSELISIERDFPEAKRPLEIESRYQWLLRALAEPDADTAAPGSGGNERTKQFRSESNEITDALDSAPQCSTPSTKPLVLDIPLAYLPKDADNFIRRSTLGRIAGELVAIERDFPDIDRPTEIQRRHEWLLNALSESRKKAEKARGSKHRDNEGNVDQGRGVPQNQNLIRVKPISNNGNLPFETGWTKSNDWSTVSRRKDALAVRPKEPGSSGEKITSTKGMSLSGDAQTVDGRRSDTVDAIPPTSSVLDTAKVSQPPNADRNKPCAAEKQIANISDKSDSPNPKKDSIVDKKCASAKDSSKIVEVVTLDEEVSDVNKSPAKLYPDKSSQDSTTEASVCESKETGENNEIKDKTDKNCAKQEIAKAPIANVSISSKLAEMKSFERDCLKTLGLSGRLKRFEWLGEQSKAVRIDAPPNPVLMTQKVDAAPKAVLMNQETSAVSRVVQPVAANKNKRKKGDRRKRAWSETKLSSAEKQARFTKQLRNMLIPKRTEVAEDAVVVEESPTHPCPKGARLEEQRKKMLKALNAATASMESSFEKKFNEVCDYMELDEEAPDSEGSHPAASSSTSGSKFKAPPPVTGFEASHPAQNSTAIRGCAPLPPPPAEQMPPPPPPAEFPAQMHPRFLGQRPLNPAGQMHLPPVQKLIPLGQMPTCPPGKIHPHPAGQMRSHPGEMHAHHRQMPLHPPGQMHPHPPGQMPPHPPGQMPLHPPGQMHPHTPGQMPLHPPGQMHPHPPGQMPSHPPGQMPSHPPGQMPSHPPGQMHPHPLGQMPSHPPGQMPSHPPGQMPSHPPGQMHPHPPGQMHPHPPGQMPSHPPGQMPSHPPGQMHPHPPGQMPSHPPGQMPSHPPGQMPLHPPVQMPSHPPGQMPSYPPGQMHPHPPGQMPPHSPGQMPTRPPGLMPPHSRGEMHPQFPGQMPPHLPGQVPTCPPGQMPQPNLDPMPPPNRGQMPSHPPQQMAEHVSGHLCPPLPGYTFQLPAGQVPMSGPGYMPVSVHGQMSVSASGPMPPAISGQICPPFAGQVRPPVTGQMPLTVSYTHPPPRLSLSGDQFQPAPAPQSRNVLDLGGQSGPSSQPLGLLKAQVLGSLSQSFPGQPPALSMPCGQQSQLDPSAFPGRQQPTAVPSTQFQSQHAVSDGRVPPSVGQKLHTIMSGLTQLCDQIYNPAASSGCQTRTQQPQIVNSQNRSYVEQSSHQRFTSGQSASTSQAGLAGPDEAGAHPYQSSSTDVDPLEDLLQVMTEQLEFGNYGEESAAELEHRICELRDLLKEKKINSGMTEYRAGSTLPQPASSQPKTLGSHMDNTEAEAQSQQKPTSSQQSSNVKARRVDRSPSPDIDVPDSVNLSKFLKAVPAQKLTKLPPEFWSAVWADGGNVPLDVASKILYYIVPSDNPVKKFVDTALGAKMAKLKRAEANLESDSESDIPTQNRNSDSRRSSGSQEELVREDSDSDGQQTYVPDDPTD